MIYYEQNRNFPGSTWLHSLVPTRGSEKECGEMLIQFWFQTYTASYYDVQTRNIISDSAITFVLLMRNSRSLTPSRSLENTILVEFECYACFSVWFVTKQTVKQQQYKWKTGDFPVPVSREINHGSSTSLPATFELIAFVWTSQTLFCNRKGRNRYCRNHAHFTILFFRMQQRGWHSLGRVDRCRQ